MFAVRMYFVFIFGIIKNYPLSIDEGLYDMFFETFYFKIISYLYKNNQSNFLTNYTLNLITKKYIKNHTKIGKDTVSQKNYVILLDI